MLLSINNGYQAVFERGPKWLPEENVLFKSVMAFKYLDWVDQPWSSEFCEPLELP